ncbi:MAG TPA: hypothetical protein VGA85_02085 [Dehalococcoidales bacterium]
MPIDSSPNSASTSLDIYEVPVKKKLEAHIVRVGYSAAQLNPIIDAAIQEGKRSITDAVRSLSPIVIRERIYRSAVTYIESVLSQTKKWNLCRELIRNYSSVFLAGAGVSFESELPLSDTLEYLKRFCKATSWIDLRSDISKCHNFKLQFKIVSDRKVPSASHKLLIKNFPSKVLEIICLNWDDLFERAANLQKRTISKQNQNTTVTGMRHLWKFHGDVALITNDNVAGQGGWIFPDQDGYVFDSFIQYTVNTNLKNEPFTFIIIGYNEKEQAIYDKIIRPLELSPPRPTYRIGLQLDKLHDQTYIVGTSDFVLKQLLPGN